eukprot:3617283-Amphidinium_carterae.1
MTKSGGSRPPAAKSEASQEAWAFGRRHGRRVGQLGLRGARSNLPSVEEEEEEEEEEAGDASWRKTVLTRTIRSVSDQLAEQARSDTSRTQGMRLSLIHI